MKTDTTEKGLETLIVGGMTAQGLWIAGHPTGYDRGYAIDLHQLRHSLRRHNRLWSKPSIIA
jgi:hypothetical protein